jgi:hypothetical protein
MKRFVLSAFALGALASAVCADENAGTALVTNNHGGYNVVQPGAQAAALPFFGSHGYAAHVVQEARTGEKPKFILVPVAEDVGHGQKVIVYKKIYFATAEEAAAAKAKM